MLALVSIERLIPSHHPLRRVKPLADAALRELDPTFEEMYARVGRPSVPPEQLLKASLLMALYSVRSERMFCEQLGYNMLFRWFLDMDMTAAPFDPTVFSHNRERMLQHAVAERFFAAVVGLADDRGLLSDDHFSVDGTLIEAAGSLKSFCPKEQKEYDSRAFPDYRGTRRKNDTHASKTDPDSRLYTKGRGQAAKLSYMAHALMENRHGLVVAFDVTEASGTAERDAALELVERARRARKRRRQGKTRKKRHRQITLGADKNYDTRAFVAECRSRGITPHVAQHKHARRSSAIDGRTTRHPGYRASQTARMLTEKIFGWLKVIGGFRRSRYFGRPRTRAAGLYATATFNLLRIANLPA